MCSSDLDVEALKASLNQIQIAIDKEDYPAAQTQAKVINDKGQAVSAEIQNALAKVGKGKLSAPKKKVGKGKLSAPKKK